MPQRRDTVGSPDDWECSQFSFFSFSGRTEHQHWTSTGIAVTHFWLKWYWVRFAALCYQKHLDPRVDLDGQGGNGMMKNRLDRNFLRVSFFLVKRKQKNRVQLFLNLDLAQTINGGKCNLGEWSSQHQLPSNHKIMNNATKNFKKNIVNHTIKSSCNIIFDKTHTPRALFAGTLMVLLYNAHEKNWDLKEEMQEWDVDDEWIAKLTALDEEAQRLQLNDWSNLFEQ